MWGLIRFGRSLVRGSSSQVDPEEVNMTGINIKLKYDLTQTQSIIKDHEVAIMFRVMYWAAYLGKKEMVEEIIRHGYSPFVRSFEKKNALMAAIDSKQVEIV